MASGTTLIVLMVVALAAPLVEVLYGIGPQEQFQHKPSSLGGIAHGYLGGVSGEHVAHRGAVGRPHRRPALPRSAR